MPLRATGVRSPWFLGPALLANDAISFDRNRGLSRRTSLPYGRLLSSRACRELTAPLSHINGWGGALWWDAVALDAGRLTLEPLLMAAEAGAAIANHVEARALMLQQGNVRGVVATDLNSGRDFEIKSSVVIDATGPWAGQLSAAKKLTTTFLPPAWIGGLNLVLRKSLGIDKAVALSATSKAADRSAVLRRATRELFFVPWRGVTMVGTDYVEITDRQAAQAGPPADAVARFLDEILTVAPKATITRADVGAVHWGLLPLATIDAGMPKKSPTLVSGRDEAGARGLVVVIGEKLTSAPTLSQQVVRRAAQELGLPANTGAARLPQRATVSASTAAGMSVDAALQTRFMARYGQHWMKAAALAADRPELSARIHSSTDIRRAEIVHAIRHEMALDLGDLLRRLDLGSAAPPANEVVRACAEAGTDEFGWDREELERQLSRTRLSVPS